jgi:hypothetical protein
MLDELTPKTFFFIDLVLIFCLALPCLALPCLALPWHDFEFSLVYLHLFKACCYLYVGTTGAPKVRSTAFKRAASPLAFDPYDSDLPLSRNRMKLSQGENAGNFVYSFTPPSQLHKGLRLWDYLQTLSLYPRLT